MIAKLAHGIADDMLTTTVLACTCPKIIVPAMNTRMYENAVTQDNLRKLKEYGMEIVEPAEGRLACGDVGKGKMPEPDILYQYVLKACAYKKDMEGLKVLVTAGPTRRAWIRSAISPTIPAGRWDTALRVSAHCGERM